MFQSRLQPKHLANAQREALRYRHIVLSFARRAIACVQDRPQLMPVLWRRGLDDGRNRPVEQQGKQEGRGDGLVGLHALVGVPQALGQQLLDQTIGVRRQVRVDCWQQ